MCSVARINQLAIDNQSFMMATFGFDTKSCQGYQGGILSTVRDINGPDLCNSSVVQDYLTSSTCGYLNPRNSSQPCSTVLPYITCMAARLSGLTNGRCSNIHPLNLINSDVNLQNSVSACDKRFEDVLNDPCLDTKTILSLSPQIFGPCLAPLVYLQNVTSSACRVYAQSLNCMSKRVGTNCTLSTLHSYLGVYTDMVLQYATQQPYTTRQPYTTQRPNIQLPDQQSPLQYVTQQPYTTQQPYNQNSAWPNIQLPDQQSPLTNIPSIAKECTDYIVSQNASSLPSICDDSETLKEIAMPCVSTIYKSIAQFNMPTSCFMVLTPLTGCFQSVLQPLGVSCSPQKIANVLTDNKDLLEQFFPNIDFTPCLSNGTFQGICPVLIASPTTTTTSVISGLDNAFVCLSAVFTSMMSPLQQDQVCSVYSAALRCVIAKSELKGYNTSCNENNISPILTAALAVLPMFNNANTSIDKCQGSGPSTKPICKDTRVLASLAVSQTCALYLSFSQSRPGGVCGGLIECVGVNLGSSGMYCRNDEIGTALVQETVLLQQFNITFNPSECTTNRTLPSYPTSNISECFNVLQSEINPVLYCNHSLRAINRTKDLTEQCRILPDLLQCLVMSTHYTGYNCSVDQLFTLYKANNSLITQFAPKFDPLACSGATEIQVIAPRGGNLCAEPPVYPYLEKYACASYKNLSSSCERTYNLTKCVQSTFQSFDTYCTPEVSLTMIQSLPSMMYVGNVKSCNFNTPGTDMEFSTCQGLTPTSYYFTECSSNYSKILTVDGERRCPYWEDTVRCVQSNMFWNNEYCSTQAVIETLNRHPQFTAVLPGFSAETCTEDIYLAEPCKDLNLYQLTMVKCQPRHKMCGQQSLIRSCVERNLNYLGQYCSEEDITNQMKTFDTNQYRKCAENDIVLDNGRHVLIYQNGKNHSVCGYGWDDNDARVACRQMGFKEGQADDVYNYQYDRAYYSYDCTGSEDNLSNCSQHYSRSNCSSFYSAGAICYNDEYELSLVGGESGNYGQVVIKVNEVKGYLCSSYYFGDKEANALCMNLNFGGGELYKGRVPTTSMTTVWRNEVDCPTSYTPFGACLKDNFGIKPASKDSILGCNYYPQVYCYGAIRLNTQYKNRTGLVQMYQSLNGKPTLFSVCRDNVNNQTVGAVCKQIGFNNGGYLIPYNPFKTTSVNLGVRINSCTNHDDLNTCDIKVKSSEYEYLNCTSGPAVITCNTNSPDEVAENTIRMESYDGRLLVYKYGLWGGICSVGWSNTAASVYCKGQGYESGLAKEVYYNYNNDVKWWFNVRCDGNETTLKDCQYELEDKNNNCSYSRNDAAVFCFNEADVPRVSLQDGVSSNYGRVYVNIRGQEGPVCSPNAYNLAPVICRGQGYTDGEIYHADLQLPKSDGSWRSEMDCSGSETAISVCRNAGNWTWIANNASVPSEISCGREMMHEVFCYGEVRLNTGYHNTSGEVQMINREKKWEMFCPGQLNPAAYNVICRQLNLSNQGHALPINFAGYRSNAGKQYTCTGDESKLSDCPFTLKYGFCTKPIAIVCQDNFTVSDEIQDVVIQPDGRVLIKKYNVWGSVCNDLWNQTETDVLCRSRGFEGGVTKNSKYSDERRPLFPAMKCLGSETNLRDCDSSRMGNTTDSYCYSDVAVRCLEPNDKFELSIEGGSSSGRLLVTRANKTAYFCDPDYFSTEDARIVCQHLGYNDGERGQYYSGDSTILKEAWKIGFYCPSSKNQGPINLQACLEGEWVMESWMNGYRVCQYNTATVTCSGQASSVNSTSLCSNIKYFEMLDKDCDDVIDNIARAVQVSQMSACQYFPDLVRCLSEKMISRNIICTESDIFTVLRQNRDDIINITGGLNTDVCDGMKWQPSTGSSNSTGCTSLPLMSRVLPLCYQTPNKTITDPIKIQQLCSQGEMFMNCLVRELKNSANTSCRVEDISKFFAMNPTFVMEKIKFDLSKCSEQPSNTTSGNPGSTNFTTGTRIDRCSNATYFEMVDKDCDDVIDNITSAVEISQMSACQYFPGLVSCLSEKMISRDIICTESDIFTVLRQNRDDIINITGGLNTDACDGMTWQPSTGCTSLPLISRVLPQCYTTPNTTITDPSTIQQLCSQAPSVIQCLQGELFKLDITCSLEISLVIQNQQWFTDKFGFDVSVCFKLSG
ncbi:uncharacterized protein LOC126816140 [Patella vulgata]|uniref:uncharacterized protein LOC126816140 n=1 Tax=Patella vulgata TaxID=6465 RepID=UPI0024A7D2DA|nr:uncharacterized protein LOC126816140 [Patella vulgata]